MKINKKTQTVLVILAIIILGLLVLIFDTNYTIEKNLESNAHYYEYLGK